MTDCITIKKGNFPLIISVPHGGELNPSEISDRKNGTNKLDANTINVAISLSEEIKKFKIEPYLVVLNVSRKKVDVNRPKAEGCECEAAKIVWDEYHRSLSKFIKEIKAEYNKCFLIDLHGQSHAPYIEIGYCLKRDQLNEVYNLKGFIPCSVLSHGDAVDEKCILYGDKSLGFLFQKNGYASFPSPAIPFPAVERYFSGGYITCHYTSINSVLGVQLEINREIRKDHNSIAQFSHKFCCSLITYLNALGFSVIE